MPDKPRNSSSKANKLNQATDILESISDGFFSLDRHWCFIYINKRAAAIMNLQPEDILGKNIWEQCPRLLGTELELKSRKCMAEGIPQELEMPGVSGKTWFSIRVYPSTDGISIFWQDITERKKAEEALKASTEKYQTLFDSIDEGFCVIEVSFDANDKPVDYRFLEMNPAFERLTGLYAAQDKLVRSLVPELEQYWFDIYGRIALTGEPERFEREAKALNRWYDVYAFKIGEPERSKVAILFNDITGRKRAGEALKESEDRLRQYFNLGLVGMAIESRSGGQHEVNDKFCEICGYTKEELLRLRWKDLTHPDDLEKDVTHFEQMLQGKINHYSLEKRYIRKNGEIIHAIISVGCTRNQGGDVSSTFVLVVDITEQKRVEEALTKAKDELEVRIQERTSELRHSEDKFRRIFETANEGIWIVDLQGKILMANNRVSEILGFPLEEIIGRKTNNFLVADRERLIVGKMRKALSKGIKLTYERRLRHKNGSIVYLLVNSSPLLDFEGRHIANIGMMANITRRKKAENALAEAKAQLERANQQLKAYGQRITQVQEEERKRIAYELHDDTAQYLSILKLQLDSIIHSGEIQSPKLIEKLGHLEKDAGRAVDDVRRYSHELRPGILEHLGLQAALEQIAEDHNKMSQTMVEVNVEGIEPELSEDIKLGFFRIAQEAINNCRKHAKASIASINLMFGDHQMQMKVNDDGVGFDVQEAALRVGEKGNLGLLSMEERAKLIGADLRIQSKPGRGTSVIAEIVL